mgnify:CR=1 FL=1
MIRSAIFLVLAFVLSGCLSVAATTVGVAVGTTVADSYTAFRAQSRNCNSHDSVHGGVLMAFADYTLCIAANGGAHQSVVTVSQNNEFIAPAHAGDLISGRGEVVRSGGSIVFVRGELCVDDETVLICSAKSLVDQFEKVCRRIQ